MDLSGRVERTLRRSVRQICSHYELIKLEVHVWSDFWPHSDKAVECVLMHFSSPCTSVQRRFQGRRPIEDVTIHRTAKLSDHKVDKIWMVFWGGSAPPPTTNCGPFPGEHSNAFMDIQCGRTFQARWECCGKCLLIFTNTSDHDQGIRTATHADTWSHCLKDVFFCSSQQSVAMLTCFPCQTCFCFWKWRFWLCSKRARKGNHHCRLFTERTQNWPVHVEATKHFALKVSFLASNYGSAFCLGKISVKTQVCSFTRIKHAARKATHKRAVPEEPVTALASGTFHFLQEVLLLKSQYHSWTPLPKNHTELRLRNRWTRNTYTQQAFVHLAFFETKFVFSFSQISHAFEPWQRQRRR